jgi:hypothetical protein
VPPEDVDEEGADTMSESVQLEQRYCHVLAKACDALGAEPESLGASDELSQPASLA